VSNSKKNALLKFSAMAIQMGVIIGLCAWGGTAIDKRVGDDSKIWTAVLALVGVGIALYIFIREAQKLSNNDK
jgi:hypothetical protein